MNSPKNLSATGFQDFILPAGFTLFRPRHWKKWGSLEITDLQK